MNEFRVIIAGGRDFNDYDLLRSHVDRMLSSKRNTHKIIIVSGHARGADMLGERYAKECGYELETHPAQWKQYPKRAGMIRNSEMASCSDALIAFWDGESHGTRHMILEAKRKNLQVSVKCY